MSLKYFSSIPFFVIALSARMGCAETSLSLQAAINEALARNPELASFEAAVAGARGSVRTARVYSNPELRIAPGVRRTRDAGSSDKQFHGELELSQLFEFPGKRALKVAIAEKNVEVQKLALEGFRFALSAKVRRAFYDLLAAQTVTTLRKDQVESGKTFVESAKKRAESGYASDFETVKSQSELIGAQRGLLESQGKVSAARVRLNTLLGRSPGAPLTVTGTLEAAGTRPGSKQEFLALAMARNPTLRTLGVQAEAAGLTLRSTRFGRRPDFAIGPQVEYTDKEQTYGLGVTVALPFWDLKKGEIETATAEQQKAIAEIQKTRLEITAAVATATEAFEVARNQLGLYTPEFLERLKGFVAQAEQGYAQNATTLIIYLDAKRTYFDTLANYYESLGHVAEQRAELESAVGVPLELQP